MSDSQCSNPQSSFYQNLSQNLKNLFTCISNKLNHEIAYYDKLKDIENNKLTITIIKKAYDCVIAHFISIFTILIVFIFVAQIFKLLSSLILFVSFVSLIWVIFLIREKFIKKINKYNTLISIIIFLAINILIAFLMFNFFKKFLITNSNENCLILSFCINWITHSFHQIPKKFILKGILYYISCIILLIMGWPQTVFSVIVLVANIIGHSIQQYFIWIKYHENCIILNKMKTEQSINKYLEEINPQPIFHLDANLDIINMNQKAIQLFSANLKKSFNEYAEDLVLNSGQTLSNYILSNNKFSNKEFFKRRGDQIEKILVSSTPFTFGKEFNLLIVLNNITEIVNKHETKISEKYQNIILFSASHEIRSNLNIIAGSLEQLIRKFEVKSVIVAKYATKIIETKLNLLSDYVQINNSTFTEHRSKTTLRTLIDEMQDIIQLFAKEKNLNVIQKYKNEYDEQIECDSERIFSIIIHMALNSVKFTLKGHISLKAYIEGDCLLIILKDTGVGMNPLMASKINEFAKTNTNIIFENYINSLGSLNDNQFLTGLGLTSSSLICKSLGGSLTIKSPKRMGTKVCVKIKCKKLGDLINGIVDDTCIAENPRKSFLIHKYSKYIPEEPLNQQPDIQLTPRLENKTLLILVVDDQAFNRKVLKSMLETLKYENILEAENGEESVKICEKKRKEYDQITIFMDVEMPIMDGIEATKTIKSIDKTNTIKIVMQTAFNSQELISSCFQAGAIDFCVKPVSFKKLKQYKEERIILF